jgi:MOSC domain-containing protein YiiM
MKLLSIDVGLPREVEWRGKTVRTSIFKAPVLGRVSVAQLNLKGDQLKWIARGKRGVKVADIATLYTADAVNQDLLRRVSELPALPEAWRDYFRKRLWEPDA